MGCGNQALSVMLFRIQGNSLYQASHAMFAGPPRRTRARQARAARWRDSARPWAGRPVAAAASGTRTRFLDLVKVPLKSTDSWWQRTVHLVLLLLAGCSALLLALPLTMWRLPAFAAIPTGVDQFLRPATPHGGVPPSMAPDDPLHRHSADRCTPPCEQI